MKALSKILWWFIYALPAVLFFSYHPIISLGANDSMNFELSLPLIWLLLFDLGAFVCSSSFAPINQTNSQASLTGVSSSLPFSHSISHSPSSGLIIRYEAYSRLALYG